MKNSEKFKTAQERAEAFSAWCIRNEKLIGNFHKWLDLEAEEEKPLPCPFCGGSCDIKNDDSDCPSCDYNAISDTTQSGAISAHNRVAKKCVEVK